MSLLNRLRSLVQRPPVQQPAPYAEDPTPLSPEVEAGLNQYQAVKEYLSKLEQFRADLGQLIMEGHSLLPIIQATQVRARYDEGAPPPPPPTRFNPHPLWELSIRNLLERGWSYETIDALKAELKRRKMSTDVIEQITQF